MEKLIQYATKASFYNGEFGGNTGWIAAGMGYIFVTSEGKLIVVDGGNTEDADSFVSLIRTNAPEVDLWILTHPHIDHYGALSTAVKSGDFPKIGKLVCLFGSVDDVDSDPEYDDTRAMAVSALEEILKKTEAVYVKPTEGDVYEAGSASVTMIALPTDLSYANPSSLIFSVKGKGKKVLFTGDASSDRLADAYERHRDKLKSDVLQVPHHGLCDTGYIPFYEAVGAETLLVPICESGEASMKSGDYGDATEPQLYAERHAKTIHRAYEGTVEIEL